VAKCWLLERRRVADIATASLEEFVAMAVGLKARIVAEDEFETSGRRALLNYGHTLGHAVEIVALEREPDALRHGEAVAIGLRFAARLALHLGLTDASEVLYTDDVVRAFGLSGKIPLALSIDELLAIMARDKKAHHNLTFVLPTPQGITVVADVTPEAVRATYVACKGVLYDA
jgi:3-dehydroquinate synthetase